MRVFDLTEASLEPGVTLVEASAGTGKTHSITGLILRLIVEKRMELRKILAVTFTEAATQELRERIRRRFQEALRDLRAGASDDPIVNAIFGEGDVCLAIHQLEVAVQSFDEAQIFTIHGFCQRMLNDYAFESGTPFDTVLLPDPTPLFEEIARDFWRLQFHRAAQLLPALARAWDKSPEKWVELLQQTRRHPELVIIPPAAEVSLEDLLEAVESAFAALRKEWKKNDVKIGDLLRSDPNLYHNEKHFRSDRVADLLGKIAEACERFELASPESLKVFLDVRSEAIAAGTRSNRPTPTHPFFDLSSEFCLKVNAVFNQLAHQFLNYAKEELPKRKAKTNTITYDDLIISLRDALRGKEGKVLAGIIGQQFNAALIDEFQDTDPAQYEIFRTLFYGGKHCLFLIGDPKQAIYGFRGADLFTYLEAARLADSTKLTLVTNWRAEGSLLTATNALFTRTNDPFAFPDIKYPEVSPPAKPIIDYLTDPADGLRAMNFRVVLPLEEGGSVNQTEVGGAVSADIARLYASGATLGNRPLRYNDIAVLVRKHTQGEIIQKALSKRGVRSIIHSDKNVLASSEAAELLRLLQGIIDPRREASFKGALTTSLIGFDANQLLDLDQDDKKRQILLDQFSGWRQQWVNGCFSAMFRHLLVSQQVRKRLVSLPEGERRLTNFLHLAELVHEAETTQSLPPDGVCSWLRDQRENERGPEDRFQLRLESDEDAVQIVTIHKCKGLEYPVVFCPFFWCPADSKRHEELLFHDKDDPKRQLTFDLRGRKGGGPKHAEWQSEESMAEEIRLLYVAITRAQSRSYIYLPDKKIDNSSLAQLFPPAAGGMIVPHVRELARSFSRCIDASSPDLNEQDHRPADKKKTSVILKASPFKAKISRVGMTASFSGLNAGTTEWDEANIDFAIETNDGALLEKVESDLSIFTFDRGRRTGDFFHDILEQLDFQNLDGLSELIEKKLWTYGFPETLHRPAIKRILEDMMEVELEPGMRLRNVAKHERLSELEFSHPLVHLTPATLRKVIDKSEIPATDIRTRIGRLSFEPVKGFMRGVIDLLYRFKNRYYLLDWKSNWLGNNPSDYGSEGIHKAMLKHNYYLQYYLYTLAADLFLKSRLPGYSYESDFGGVFYAFLRGIDPKDPSSGIFRDRPKPNTIAGLRRLIG